jgi:hypothetical protein
MAVDIVPATAEVIGLEAAATTAAVIAAAAMVEDIAGAVTAADHLRQDRSRVNSVT